MSIISNSNNFICEFRFIFRENNILLETQKNVPLQEQTANGTVMPSEKIFRKCIEFQAATDWFSEPEYNFSAMQLESSSPAPAGCEFIPLRDFFNMSDEKHILLSTRATSCMARKDAFLPALFYKTCRRPNHERKNLSKVRPPIFSADRTGRHSLSERQRQVSSCAARTANPESLCMYFRLC